MRKGSILIYKSKHFTRFNCLRFLDKLETSLNMSFSAINRIISPEDLDILELSNLHVFYATQTYFFKMYQNN